MCSVMGYTEQEMIGKNWFEEFIPKDARKKSIETFQGLITGMISSPLQQENYIQTKAGDVLLIHWQHNALKNKEGEFFGSFSSGEDITEKYLLQFHLADQYARKRKEVMNAVLQATEAERRDIAHELHDGVNQVLTVCKLLLETEIEEGNSSTRVERVFDTLKDVIHEIRNLAHNLDPVDYIEGGIYDAVKELAQKLNLAGRFLVRLKVRGKKWLHQLPREVSLPLFRILQESLNNIMKHAEASEVLISLTGSKIAADLEIKDNGKGFVKSEGRYGLGLRTIYTRAEAAGGKAHIFSAPGEGTLLSVHIPLT
jgi:PAS domain S-box-containing protein